MDPSTSAITVIGGGIAGLAAALALAPRHTTLLEQAGSFSEVGAGLQLGPNAVRALQQLGAWDAVAPVTSAPEAIHMHDGLTGNCLKTLELGPRFSKRFGAPYRVAHRADLHAALLGCVKANHQVDLRLNQRVTGILPAQQGATLVLGAARHDVPTVIAADGVHSLLRQALFPGTAALHSGHHMHRALIAMPRVQGVNMHDVNLWMLPHGHVVHYPVGKMGLLNVVAVTPRHQSLAQVFKQAAAAPAEILSLMPTDVTPWEGCYAPPLPRWNNNTALLIGDAAHATVPYLAQGAAMALEDAAELKRSFASALTFAHAFAEVSSRRRARCLRLQTESLKAGRTYHMAGPSRALRNAGLRLLPEALMLSKLGWIYNGH